MAGAAPWDIIRYIMVKTKNYFNSTKLMIIKRKFPFYFIFCDLCSQFGSYSLGAAAQRVKELDEVENRCEGLVINQYVSQSVSHTTGLTATVEPKEVKFDNPIKQVLVSQVNHSAAEC